MSDFPQTFNKVVVRTSKNNLNVIDLSEDTVAPNNLLSGITAHDNSGDAIVGRVNVEGGGVIVVDDRTIKVNENGEIYVNTANDAEKDNTLPITAAAVYTEIGNIDVLLQSI